MSRHDTTAAGMAAVADAAREALAGELFDVPTVLAGIEEASRQGRTWVRLTNQHRIEFDGTKAWRRLLRRLEELGYVARREWIMPVPGEDEELKHSELVIGWGKATAMGMASPLSLLTVRDIAREERADNDS